ncbi:carcinine hydrolase/isopenicillin-N N-acyltransferase family protein [Micromonospora sp. 4G57]|uniref:Carcinine hydrolase/isopenicillin-N N-acyltransferase family protein n=1 Tax=Micromonospora sicca TaxID=2202420 RepID=A0ABU5J710_9ACTN|nr:MULTISPECIES: carcinine hydrolase/isopenicillin-N N-acyltransferase family protein [unclassified Micromonospora]MDZ5442957.1 carcinine hydrolase/isopenicillin-N N-acyltransferase family protein [Micromonospora sp. 4G57]MDZ5488332.1 carcinine hydrolase/isopenicillin-N N-acyltransferase family protein [Micromonospora sp. 4G53]
MRRRTLLAAGGALMLSVTACTRAPTAAPRPAPAGTPTASRQDPGQVERTLASLRKVDDLPLYEMTYAGDYDPTVGISAPPTASPFGCSLFAALGDRGRPLFARNFDWEPNPALVLRTDPPDGYASISLVDISYLGVGPDPAGDRRLLNAPLLPFDGMNERGLAVGLAADDRATARPVPGRPTAGSVRILRLVLDNAATVDEAIGVFERYNLDFAGGPPLHYLLADATGASAVVEFVDGRLRAQRGRGRWQALTNVPVIDVPERRLRQDHRYGVVAAALDKAGGAVDSPAALKLLDAVRQPHTRWSVTYGLRTGEVRLVTARGGGERRYQLAMS